MDFENKLIQLENIVKQLEDRNISLEKGIDLYSEGLKLTKECIAELNQGKEKIKALQDEMNALFNGEDDKIDD